MKKKNAGSAIKVHKSHSPGMEAWIRLRKNKRAVVMMIIIGIIFLIAIFANVIVKYEVCITQDPVIRLQEPSAEHWFGTDNYGRDIFARIIHGTRIAILFGFGATAIAMVLATIIGTSTAYFGGLYDNIITRILDTLMTIPVLLLAIAIVSGFGSGLVQLMLAMTVGQTPSFSRIVRSSALAVSGQDYVEAARALGAPDFWIIMKYIVPNVISTILLQGTMQVGANILMGATLSFVGLGVQAPTPEWGMMMSESMQYFQYKPYLVLIPGLALVITSLAINTFGDCLRDAFDPRLKGKA